MSGDTTAVVATGGGSNGDHLAGVLLGAFEAEAFPDGIDAFYGTSIGAWSAAFMAQVPKSEGFNQANELYNVWLEVLTGSTKTVWKERWRWLPRPFRYASAVFKPSIGLNDGARELLDELVDFERVNDSDVHVSVNTVDLRTGRHCMFTTPELRPEHVMGSSSFPGVFPPEEIDDGYHTDGGLTDMGLLGQAIRDGHRRIIVISSRDPDRVPVIPSLGPESSLLGAIAPRLAYIVLMEMLRNDIRTCERINDWIDKGYLNHPDLEYVRLEVVMPKGHLGNPLDFTLKKVEPQLIDGRELAHERWGDVTL